jgi:CO/xanthine dehydrogenase Mo-binding subunit
MSAIGKSFPRPDGPGKVTGKTLFAFDLVLPGMLFGRIARAPIAAGRLRKLDTARARAMPGVRAVLTAQDVPAALAGCCLRDTELFARQEIRYVGEPVAAVAADTAEQAAAAVNALEMEIDPMIPIVDLDAAVANDARLIHPEVTSYQTTYPAPMPRGGNIACHVSTAVQDVTAAFAAAAHIVEDRFVQNRQYQAYLEPKVAVCQYADDRYIVHAGHQAPQELRQRISQFLAVPETDVRIVGHPYGGGFGGKLDFSMEPYACALSKASGGRPVRIAYGRSEDLQVATCRENSIIKIRTAVATDGSMLARDIEMLIDNGAYCGDMPLLTSLILPFACGVYRVGACKANARLVYTNTPSTGSFRGVSGVAIYTAVERHMDHVARTLDVDRLAYRQMHAWHNGDAMPTGQILADADILQQAFREVADAIGWDQWHKSPRPYRGLGIAGAVWTVNPLPSAATVRIESDGRVRVITGANDCGTGAVHGGIRQVVAEELGVAPEQVQISPPDTDAAAWDGGAQGSRTVQVAGGAAQKAARIAKTQLLEVASGMLGDPVDDLIIENGTIRSRINPSHTLRIEAASTAALYTVGQVQGSATHLLTAPAIDATRACGMQIGGLACVTWHVHAAEVEVDPVTGNVAVLRYVVAQEVGRIGNPDAVFGQIQGAVAQAIGLTMCESLRIDEVGRYVEQTLEAYRLPLAADMPRVQMILLEHPAADGPFGMKGCAEPPVVLGAAVLGNAIAQAVGGSPFACTPITPEDVLERVMQIKEGAHADASPHRGARTG